MVTARLFTTLGAILAGLGVLLGAYQAHGLEQWLMDQQAEPAAVARRMDNAAIAVRYQTMHALALLVLGGLLTIRPSRLLVISCSLITVGVGLFSGGLYLIVFAGTAIHWSIVPAGGVTLAIGWFVAATALGLPAKDAQDQDRSP